MRHRALVILNPAAGRGRARRAGPRLQAAGAALGWTLTVRETRDPGHETELAADARREGWPVVIAAGGDGTVHGVVNGLLADGGTDIALGHVPIGSGNDFAHAIGLRRGAVEENLRIVLDGERRRVDVGRTLGEYFINGFGLGFGAAVVRETMALKRLRGFALYLGAALRTFVSFEPPELEVQAAEHTERGRLMMVEVCNGPTAGGGFRLTPTAVPDDGILDVCVIRQVGLVRFLRYLPRVIRGTHLGLPPVTVFRTTRLTLVTPPPFIAHLDGELRRSTDAVINVELIPKQLTVLCAPS